jgi:hypothetical protein
MFSHTHNPGFCGPRGFAQKYLTTSILFFKKEPKTLALRGLTNRPVFNAKFCHIPISREADPGGLHPKNTTRASVLFFFKKEPKTLALRGLNK